MDGLIPRNPADAVRLPQLRREEIRPLTAEQVRALLEAADERDRTFYTVAVHTGMRPGEMLALRWADVDLEAGTAQINRALSEGKFTKPRAPAVAGGSS